MAFTPTYDTPQLQAPILGYSGLVTTANTARDGTGTVSTIFTADATNGGRAFRVTAMAAGTNPQSVLRIFYNNGDATSTASNNVLIAEVDLPPTTASASLPLAPVYKDLNLDIPPSTNPGRITCCVGTSGTDGWYFSCTGRKY